MPIDEICSLIAPVPDPVSAATSTGGAIHGGSLDECTEVSLCPKR
ncbi:hypothetical protein [Gemmobacter denitrificans]|uniref:Uncharacterized protein n=1 Tax=Gemmobacter denitrificans TaxID=3123040 RepID=A0ABU8C0A0_9RHOB